MRPHLGFEPGFRVPEIERMAAVWSIGRSQPGKFGGAPGSESRPPLGAWARGSRACEFQPMHAKAELAIAAVDRLHAAGLVERRIAGTRGLPAEQRTRRLAGMLARKGYPPGLAYRVIREALEAEGESAALEEEPSFDYEDADTE